MCDAFRDAGFRDIQIGKEAIFDLSRFSLAGGLMELVRAATNKARREGVVVSEHRPFALGGRSVNDELRAISDEWLRSKGEHEFGFASKPPGAGAAPAKGISSRVRGSAEEVKASLFVNPSMAATVIT
jgi:lysylphosphatidylglycerol synthetase-like protein (DUF2156 family)